jgi:hypothetical protein
VRNGRQRMPVPCMSMGKCADNAIACETLRDLRVLVNIYVIIKINEIVPERLTKNQPADRDQGEANIKRRKSKGGALPLARRSLGEGG